VSRRDEPAIIADLTARADTLTKREQVQLQRLLQRDEHRQLAAMDARLRALGKKALKPLPKPRYVPKPVPHRHRGSRGYDQHGYCANLKNWANG
jgi:hypothetical protein